MAKPTIARIDFRSADIKRSITHALRSSTPVIITGALDEEPLWTIDHLQTHIGEHACKVRHYGRKKFAVRKSDWNIYIKSMPTMTFNEYARLLRNGEANAEHIYYAQQAIDSSPLNVGTFKAVAGSLGLEPKSGVNIWCGPGGHKEPLHYDHADGILYQVCGGKRIRLFPYAQTRNLYPFPASATVGWWFSQVDPDRPDFASYPNFRLAQEAMIEVELEEREALLMPWGWWHENKGIGDPMVCSVNQFFTARPWWRSPAVSPRPLLITATEKARALQAAIGLRSNVRSKRIETTHAMPEIVKALQDPIAINLWYQRDLVWSSDQRFEMRINNRGVPVDIQQHGPQVVVWKLHGQKKGVASGSIQFQIRAAAGANSTEISATQFDVSPALSKHVRGMLNHSLISLRDYLDSGEGDPFLAT